MTRLRECEMSPAVAAWLEAQGLTVYAEIPYRGHCIDHAGLADDRIVVVEMKRCLGSAVFHQLVSAKTITFWTYAAVASRPSATSLGLFRKQGMGVVGVREGVATVLLEARQSEHDRLWKPHAEGFRQRCIDMGPGGVAGVPCLKGEGPAQDVYHRVCTYRAAHPDAKWAEIFKEVGNHYATPSSMRGGMEFVEMRRRRQATRHSHPISPAV